MTCAGIILMVKNKYYQSDSMIFSDVAGKLEWQGDADQEQRKICDEC